MLTDAELVESAQSGDEKAFETLVEKHRARIDATISSFISNAQDREDIAQETFINAYRNLHQLSKPDSFRYWLVTIAQNLCRNWLSKNRSHTIPIDEVDENLLDSDNSPERESIEAEQQQIIAQAIKALPETERQIASAHYLEGESHKELVNRHGISYEAVCARLSRAKQKLSKRLGHLLTGVFVSPITTLKQIYSGGLTVMKVGTVPKITAGVVVIIVLAFIGTRPFLSSRKDSSPSVEVVTSTPNETAQTDAALKGVVTAPVREDKPQISAEEMQQIEDFFAQLDEADARSGVDRSQLPSESETKSSTTDTNASAESTGFSAEELMDVYVEAYRNHDYEALLPYVTGTARDGVETFMHMFSGGIEEEYLNTVVDLIPEVMPEGTSEETADGAIQGIEEIVHGPMMQEYIQSMFRQVEVMSSEYVGDEFHFQLRIPMPKIEMPDLSDMPDIPGLELPKIPEMPESIDMTVKMQKVDGSWQIYESEDEVVYH